MKTQGAVQKVMWREFPIDPLATMALRLAQMRLALDAEFSRASQRRSAIGPLRRQVRSMKHLVQAAETIPLLVILLVILDRIDEALKDRKFDFAHQAIMHLERTLLRAI